MEPRKMGKGDEMSKKHKNLIRNKAEYSAYRGKLISKKVRSYVDQFGKTYTFCAECDDKKCTRRADEYGCMKGTPKKEIGDIIGKR